MSGLEVWLLPSLWFFLLNPKWIDSHWFHLKASLIQQLHTHGSFLTWTVGKVFSTTLSGSRISLFSVFCCFCSVTQSCTTLCDSHKLRHTRVPCSSPSSQSLIKLMSIGSVMPSNHLILCCHLPLLPLIFTSIRVFSNDSFLHIRWPKYWSFSFSISPANEYSGLISFRMDWFDLLAVQGTLTSLLQYHSSKTSILWHSAFFIIVQLSHAYMTIGKTIALTRWTFVGKVMSLIFNMLSRLVIAFLPRSKCLLISQLQSLSAVILEPKRIVSHCSHCFPICLPWSDGTGCHDLSFLNVEC